MRLRDLLLCGFITILICSCSKRQNDLTWQEVNGPVKALRTTGYEATEKFGEISEGNVLYEKGINNLIEFNEKGFITSISDFDYRGYLSQKSIFIYDSDGIISKINNYDGDGKEIGRTIYTYNEKQKITRIVDYDKSGRVNYTQKIEWDGNKLTKTQFITEYSEDCAINVYDGNKLIKSVVYDKDGHETGEYTVYDNNDRMKERVTKDFTVSLTYNDKGLCSSIVNGRLITTNSYYWGENESYTYDYEYDKKGNWVRKVEREKDSKKATRVFVREIEYY